MPKLRSKTPEKKPWWLSEGDEECPHCGALYLLELEFRCTECDGPSCPHCKVVHTDGLYVCVSCVESGQHG